MSSVVYINFKGIRSQLRQLREKHAFHVVNACGERLSLDVLKLAINIKNKVDPPGRDSSYRSFWMNPAVYEEYMDQRKDRSTYTHDGGLPNYPIKAFNARLIQKPWMPRGYVFLIDSDKVVEGDHNVSFHEPGNTVMIFRLAEG